MTSTATGGPDHAPRRFFGTFRNVEREDTVPRRREPPSVVRTDVWKYAYEEAAAAVEHGDFSFPIAGFPIIWGFVFGTPRRFDFD